MSKTTLQYTPQHTLKYKGQNGILYIVAGSKQYHGALWYAVMAAEPLVDLIYVETDPSNHALVQSLKQLHPAIILVTPRQRKQYLAKSHCLLIGPGLGRGLKPKQLVRSVLTHPQRPAATVLDADALYYLQPNWINSGTILTPHPGEMRPVFMSDRHPGVVLQKGIKAAICQNGKCEYNTGGISSLTKGGIGDVLAGVIAGLACTQPAKQAAQQGSRLLAVTQRQLYRRYGRFATTRQIIEQLPLTYQRYLQS